METVEKQLDYWQEQLRGVEPLNLPTDNSRSIGKGKPDASVTFTIERELSDELVNLSGDRKLPLFTVLLTVFKVLLFRCSNQTDVCVLSAGLNFADKDNRAHKIARTLAVRCDLDDNPTFDDLLTKVHHTALDACRHQISFESVAESLATELNTPLSHLFRVAFSFRQTPGEVSDGQDMSSGNFELVFNLNSQPDGIRGSIEYCSDLYNESSISRLRFHYIELLKSAVKDPQRRIGELNMLRDDERRELLEDFSGSEVDYPRNKTIVDLLSDAATKYTSSTAVILGSEAITYRELDERSNQLGHYLRILGVKEDSLVPVCLDRSAEMIIAMVGILKAGGAYVPVDPDYPSDRIEFILKDVSAAVIITNGPACEKILPFAGASHIVALDRDNARISEFVGTPVGTMLQPSNLAYVIYTSGSTGQPKGVAIEHHSVVRLFENDRRLYDFNETDVWTMFHSFCFDFSVWEMYGALFYGGRLIVVDKETARDTISFGELIIRESVTVLNQTPSAFYVLQEYLTMRTSTLGVRYVIFGGEALTPSRLKPWKKNYPACRLINMYGITETTVHVTFQELNESHMHETTSIVGRPIPTLRVYILDQWLEPVPIGVEGEIYVEGAGVARGYLNRDELTKQRFIANKFGSGRLYKSGDLGRWMVNGSIEYLGRADEQVKISGFRIEPAEIEHVLESSGMFDKAVVLARKDNSGNQRLIGYVCGEEKIEQSKVQAYLAKKIPHYMIPSTIVQVRAFPLTVNGKVDKRRLLSKEYTRK